MKTCRIIITNEVIAKIEGLELYDKRKLAKKWSFDIPHARYTPAFRLGRWDGKEKFFSATGSTYVSLLEEIIPDLVDMHYEIDLIDNRRQYPEFVFPTVDSDTYSNIIWPEGHPMEGQPVILRDHQVEIINKFFENNHSVVEAATSSGKTIVTAALSKECEPYGKTLVIVPNKSLVYQTYEDYVNMGLDVGLYFGDQKDYDKTHTICTWQSLNVLIKNTSNGSAPISFGEFVDGVIAVIIDECHQAKSEILKKLLTQYFGHVPLRWGLTGTIPKPAYEQMSLLVSLGPVTHKVKAAELQEAGILSNCHVNVRQLKDYGEYKTYPAELKYLVTDKERVAYIADMIDKIKDDGNTLVLVDRIETGNLLQIELSNMFSLLSDKPEVTFVSGKMKATDRKEEYDEIKTADSKVLIATYGVAAVGINIVRLHNIVLIEPGKSFVRVIQSIGRGLRKGFDKDHVEIYDISSTLKFSARHLRQRIQYYVDAEYPYDREKINWK